MNGSGSGIEPAGQMQLNDPGKLIQSASFPQLLLSEHSFMSVNIFYKTKLLKIHKRLRFKCYVIIPVHCLNAFPVNPGLH